MSASENNKLAAARLANVATSLERLAIAPPQTLLLEGGTESQRLELALSWAMSANCPAALQLKNAGKAATPCRECAVCRQIQSNENLDLLIYDGRIANKQDEEDPGPIRAMRMENMRDLKSLISTAPHGSGKRVVIFQGMSQIREEALNSLLKALEEPSEHTLFVLLASQRQQLLPTLISRSFCLTLPWPDALALDTSLNEWEQSLARFFSSGKGFMDKVGVKGAIDSVLAGRILLACQRALARILGKAATGQLDQALAPLAKDERKIAIASRWLGEAQEMLAANVSPGRVLEAFSARMYILMR